MIALPGPAFIVIPIGLGILGLEFAWARRWLKTVKEKAEAAAEERLANREQIGIGPNAAATNDVVARPSTPYDRRRR